MWHFNKDIRMKNIYNVVLLSLLIISLASCKKDLLDLNPYDNVGSGQMWNTENLANKGVIGVYNALRNENVGAMYSYDQYAVSTSNRDRSQDMLLGTITTGSGLFTDYWKSHYEGVHRANDAIMNLPKAPLTKEKKARLIAESKVLRAFFYYKLNIVFKGVPLYLEPIDSEKANRPKETEEKIWEVILKDLSDAIDEPNLPDKYKSGSSDFGRVTKSLAYSLRGKAYLWLKKWAEAEADFKKVGEAGHKLFEGGYKELFKEVNEESDEMIFAVQYLPVSGYGNSISFRYGSRVTFGSCWNTYLPNTDFVDSYTYANGKPFKWSEVFPNWESLSVNERVVYFLRDGITEKEKEAVKKKYGVKNFDEYLPNGNEARLKAIYETRDPRLNASIITPYSEYLGAIGSKSYTYTLRWPYRGYDEAEPFDVRTDTNNNFFYLYRKFVAEGESEIPNREYSPIDYPIIRYADILLNLAEALNEQGKVDEAVENVNLVRARAGVAELNTNEFTTITSTDDLRVRIQNERRWEFNGEGVTFFDELRWKTWEESKFYEGAGHKEIWGAPIYSYSWSGDKVYHWPVPLKEIQKNPNLKPQVVGWDD